MKLERCGLFAIALLGFCSLAQATPITTDYAVVADTWLDSVDVNGNKDGDANLQIRRSAAASIRRSLVQWDLSEIASGSTVQSVELWARTTSTSATSFNPSLYRLDSAWDETTATWNNASAGTPWTTAGGDTSGSEIKLNWNNFLGFKRIDQVSTNASLVSLVQDWVDTPGSNNGALILRDFSDAAGSVASAANASGYTPVTLKVTYEPLAIPEPGSLALIGSAAALCLFRRRNK